MATETARILQSTGLDGNRGLVQPREMGITSDTERPVIGSTVGGTKYLATEQLIDVATAAPAPLPIFRRSLTNVYCDTSAAVSEITVDITAGAQIKGYTAQVFAIGPYTVHVTYGAGKTVDIVGYGMTVFVWSGGSWEVQGQLSPTQLLEAIKTVDTDTSGLNAQFWHSQPITFLTPQWGSRVCDLDGNSTPDIPDDPAGVTYLQDAWATTDAVTSSGCTLSVSNGKLIITATASTYYVYRNIPSTSAKLLISRLKCNAKRDIYINGAPGITTLAQSVIGGVSTKLAGYEDGTVSQIAIVVPSGAIGDVIELDWWYIGTGAYTTKTIDKTGRNVMTNNGLLPVDSPFGKMLRGLGAQYGQFDSPVIGTTGTVAVHIKANSVTVGDILTNTTDATLNGFRLRVASGYLNAFIAGSASQQNISLGTIDTTNRFDFVISWNGTTVYKSINGVWSSEAQTVQMTASTINLTLCKLAVSNGNYFTGDILFRYDSRIWDATDAYRWHIDPTSVDSREVSQTGAPNAIAAYGPDGELQTKGGKIVWDSALVPALESGSYTLSFSNYVNVDSLMQKYNRYIRVGNVISFNVAIDIQATAVGDVQFRMIFPTGISSPISTGSLYRNATGTSTAIAQTGAGAGYVSYTIPFAATGAHILYINVMAQAPAP